MRRGLAAAAVGAGAAAVGASVVLALVVATPSGTAPFSFQQAYDAAVDGAVIAVPPGEVVVDAPSRNSVTIFGGSKRVTFTCADPTGVVTHNSGWFTIKASNVTLRGGCFKLHALRIGEPGDTRRTASGVLIDGPKLDGLEVVGTQAVVRNVEIGPNVHCYAQGSTQPAAMKCNPNGPAYESFYANRGTGDLPFQPYFHQNSGGVRPQAVLENSYVHDLQTKDADRLHTGCGLIWSALGGQPGDIVFRGNRFERCAVLGLLFATTDGVTIEGNTFGPPVEPLSNPNGGQEAGDAWKELIVRTEERTGASYTFRGWRVTGNTFSHGTRATDVTAADTVFDGNYLGRANVCWAGATYLANTGTNACGSSPPPPPAPPPPPPPPPVDSLPLTVVSQTTDTLTLSWPPLEGELGYRFLRDGRVTSATWDTSRQQVRFGKGSAEYRVEALMPGPAGSYRP